MVSRIMRFCALAPIAGALLASRPAFADASLTIAVGPFFTDIAPLVTAIVVPIVGYGVAKATKLFAQKTGLDIQASAVEEIRKQAETGVGVAIAAAADNLANAKIAVGSPIAATIVNAILTNAPKQIAKAGITPSLLEHIVLGEFGKKQATMTIISPKPAPALPEPIVPEPVK